MASKELMVLSLLRRLNANCTDIGRVERFRLFFLGSMLWCASLAVYADSTDSVVFSKVAAAFKQITNLPSEKVYVHTDKSNYLSCDTIWMETYLVNSITHSPETGSKYVYVELLDRKNTVLQRKKFERFNDKSMPGFIALPANMGEGNYYLRAYTRWMLNESPNYFFYKNLTVSSSQHSFLTTKIRYKEDESKRTAIVQLSKVNGGYYAKQYVNYMVRTKPNGNSFHQQMTNDDGEIFVDIPPKEDVEQYIYIILDDKKNQITYKRTFYVPEAFDFHVDFFPEGGELIVGNMQKVAFKAQASNGQSIDVLGEIIDSEGDTVANFQSLHVGIGNFMLNVIPNKQYTAVVHTTYNGKSITKKFALPLPSDDDYALTISTRKGKAYYQVLQPQNGLQHTFYIVGHLRGFVLFVNKLIQPTGMIDITNIPDGIVSLTLIDDSMIPYSERLLFIHNMKSNCKIVQDKPNYESRVPVKINIHIADSLGISPQGTYSISVTDNQFVHTDSTSNNIISQLLLNSDLKGYIEDPGYYFQNDDRRTLACLDNLMLTQGWTRFRVDDILKSRMTNPKFDLELSQTVSGNVLNGSTPVTNKAVIVQVNKKNYPPLITDSNGRFILSNLQYGETGKVEASVLEKGKLLRSVLTLDKDWFPVAENKNIYVSLPQPSNVLTTLDLPTTIKTDSLWILNLPEVAVTAEMKIKDRFSSYKLNDEEMIRQQNASTAFDLVQKIPGFQIINNRPYLNPKQSLRPEMRMSTDINNREILKPMGKINYGLPVRFMLDDHSISFNILKDISANDIISVHKIDPEVDAGLGYIQNHQAIEQAYLEAFENGADEEELQSLEYDAQIHNFKDGDLRTSGGCIVLASRSGDLKIPSNDSRGDATVLLGTTKYKEFYSPKYKTAVQDSFNPDLRTTIHWQPNVPIDPNGNGSITFYTGDRKSNYTIIFEGMNTRGIPLHYEYQLKRTF